MSREAMVQAFRVLPPVKKKLRTDQVWVAMPGRKPRERKYAWLMLDGIEFPGGSKAIRRLPLVGCTHFRGLAIKTNFLDYKNGPWNATWSRER